jgi:hypothetical protein
LTRVSFSISYPLTHPGLIEPAGGGHGGAGAHKMRMRMRMRKRCVRPALPAMMMKEAARPESGTIASNAVNAAGYMLYGKRQEMRASKNATRERSRWVKRQKGK